MKKSTRDRLAIGFGFVAGTLLGFYLTSDEGRRMRKKIREHIDELSEEYKYLAQDQLDAIAERMESIMAKGEEYLDEFYQYIKRELDKGVDSIFAGAKDTFLEGLEKGLKQAGKEKHNGTGKK